MNAYLSSTRPWAGSHGKVAIHALRPPGTLTLCGRMLVPAWAWVTSEKAKVTCGPCIRRQQEGK